LETDKNGVGCQELEVVGGERFVIDKSIDLPLDKLFAIWATSLAMQLS